MAEHTNLYQRAVYYDIVFQRDVSSEVDFLTRAFTHYSGSTLGSVVDLACGPAYHAREFARRGIRAAGLDLRPEMIQFARDQATAEGLWLAWLVADMRNFRLNAPVDLAISMFDSIDALTRNADLVEHFQSVAKNLNANGLYVIDLTHPRECSYDDYGNYQYQGSRGGVDVTIHWATNQPRFDLISGVAQVAVEMCVSDHGDQLVIRDSALERLLYPQEIHLLAQLSGALEVRGWHGDYNLAQPLDATDRSKRMIAVLGKHG